jgi:hypothetical protein
MSFRLPTSQGQAFIVSHGHGGCAITLRIVQASPGALDPELAEGIGPVETVIFDNAISAHH